MEVVAMVDPSDMTVSGLISRDVVFLDIEDIHLQFHASRGVTAAMVAARLRELADELEEC